MSSKNSLGFQTEVEFELPKGFVDGNGVLHRRGVMRLATAADEITPLRDPRVQQNPAYLAIIVLSRVLTRLGTVPDIGPNVIEGLFAADLDYLQRLYERINSAEESEVAAGPGVAVRTEPALNGRGFRTVGEA